MKAALKNREITGWPVLLPDETWIYLTAHDDRVCVELCIPLDNKRYPGDVVATAFKNGEAITSRTIKANTHRPRDEFCRCALYWFDAPEVVSLRLRNELEEVVASV